MSNLWGLLLFIWGVTAVLQLLLKTQHTSTAFELKLFLSFFFQFLLISFSFVLSAILLFSFHCVTWFAFIILPFVWLRPWSSTPASSGISFFAGAPVGFGSRSRPALRVLATSAMSPWILISSAWTVPTGTAPSSPGTAVWNIGFRGRIGVLLLFVSPHFYDLI